MDGDLFASHGLGTVSSLFFLLLCLQNHRRFEMAQKKSSKTAPLWKKQGI
jgi:hypothetical protein